MKRMIAALLAVLFFVSGNVFAQGPYGGEYRGYRRPRRNQPLAPLVWSNMGMIDRLGGAGDYALNGPRSYSALYGRRRALEYGYYGDYYGYYEGQYFCPTRYRDGRPLGRTAKILIGAGVGAGIGYGVTGNARGTAIGAGAGAAVGLIVNHYQQKSAEKKATEQAIRTAQAAQAQAEATRAQSEANARFEEERAQAAEESARTTKFNVQNGTHFQGELYDGSLWLAELKPGQKINVSTPESGYRLVLWVPSKTGRLVQLEATVSPTPSGWVFGDPAH